MRGRSGQIEAHRRCSERDCWLKDLTIPLIVVAAFPLPLSSFPSLPGTMISAKNSFNVPPSCEECETQNDVVFCTGCNDYFCKKHWSKRRAHREKQPGPGGMPHEEVDPKVVERVAQCMAEPLDDSDQEQKHKEDNETTWFGLDRDPTGEPVLAEYRRYAAIMLESAEASEGPRYPALVSFIGQTGRFHVVTRIGIANRSRGWQELPNPATN